jgi:hypothetical protein
MPKPQDQLTIHTNGSADDLFELFEWFNDDDELRGRVSLPPNEIRAGEMGGLYDVLIVAAGAGGLGPALALSLRTWFTHRRSDITVTLKLDKHTEIELDAKRIDTPEITQALQNMLEQLNTAR